MDYKSNLNKGANQNLFEFAKMMRKSPTTAEKILWEYLRNNKLGFKFRRQHPIGDFIPDFYCHQKKLAIELDGSIHNDVEQRIYDNIRTEALKEIEICVLRFPNSMVEKQIEKVLELIKIHLEQG